MKIPKAFENVGRKAVPTQVIRSAAFDPGMPPPETTPATEEEISRIDTSWLPFAASTYRISPNLDDYIIVNQMICPSDLPNRNGVSFPLEELVKFLPPPMNRQVFKAWAGCPVHEEHDNEDCTKAIGVIFDTSIRKIKGYGDGKHWAVYGLIGVDKNKYPQLAAEVASGKINTGSMGCMADEFRCSVCGNKAHENAMMNCAHISSTKDVNWRYVVDAGVKKLAFLNAYGLSPIEYSVVRDPAWATCLSDNILKAEEPTAVSASATDRLWSTAYSELNQSLKGEKAPTGETLLDYLVSQAEGLPDFGAAFKDRNAAEESARLWLRNPPFKLS